MNRRWLLIRHVCLVWMWMCWLWWVVSLLGLGPVLDIVACEDPQNMRYLAFHVVDSLWDVFA